MQYTFILISDPVLNNKVLGRGIHPDSCFHLIMISRCLAQLCFQAFPSSVASTASCTVQVAHMSTHRVMTWFTSAQGVDRVTV